MHHSNGEVSCEDDVPQNLHDNKWASSENIDRYSSMDQGGRVPLSLVHSTQQFTSPHIPATENTTQTGGIERLMKACQRHREIDRQIENQVRQMAVEIARLVCEASLSHLPLPRNYRASSACGDYFLAKYDETGEVAAVFCHLNSAIVRWEPRARAISAQHMHALFFDLENGLIDEIADLVESMTSQCERAIRNSGAFPHTTSSVIRAHQANPVTKTLEELQITLPVSAPVPDNASTHMAASTPNSFDRPRTLSQLGRRQSRNSNTVERREKRKVTAS